MDGVDALATSPDFFDDAGKDLPRYVRGLEKVVAAQQLLSSARTLESVMAIVRRAARGIVGADGATLVLREGELSFYADEEAIAPLWKGRRFPIGACVAGWTMLNRETVVIEDITLDDRIPAEAYRPTFVKSLALVPIGRATPLGAIGSYWASQHRARPYEVQLLQMLADATASALENLERAAESARRLEDANRELASFAYCVSHDLRAPLRAVVGFNQALIDDHLGKLDADGADCLRRVQASAHRLGHLMDDLLELSRITRSELTRAPVNLSAIAEDIVADLARREPARRVEVVIQPGLRAEGDARLLRRALAALIGNAWKFTRPKASAQIQVSAEEDTDGVRFAVRDNGVGFDENYSTKLFSPFQRLHAADEFAGNGVGLAIVKRIVTRHGGSVSAAGKRDQGAVFAFTLPREKL